MVRAEPTNNHTAGIGPKHSTMFTLLLQLNVICEQKWIQFELQNSPRRSLHLIAKYTVPFSKPVKSDHNQNFWYFQNNHIKPTKIFSVRSNPDPPIFKKIAVRSSPDPAKIGFSPDPVRSSPDPCSSLVSCRISNPDPVHALLTSVDYRFLCKLNLSMWLDGFRAAWVKGLLMIGWNHSGLYKILSLSLLRRCSCRWRKLEWQVRSYSTSCQCQLINSFHEDLQDLTDIDFSF